MKKFTLSQRAVDDLKSIARYTEDQWGRGQRNFYLKQFDNSFQTLSETPALGVSCDLIIQGYRKFPQGSHLIFYRIVDNDGVYVTRILHTSMDVNVAIK